MLQGHRRQNPRFEVRAHAEVRGQKTCVLPVRDLSARGAYLRGNPQNHPWLQTGVSFELAIHDDRQGGAAGPQGDEGIVCQARVVRLDPGRGQDYGAGFGVIFVPKDDEHRRRLAALLLLSMAPARRLP